MTNIRDDLTRALNICKGADPAAARALEHVLKHGDRYYLLLNEDALPKVLALARNTALRFGEESGKGVAGIMATKDGAVLARAVLRLAKQVEELTELVAAERDAIELMTKRLNACDTQEIGGAVTDDPASEPRG